MAKAVGRTDATLSRIERGKIRPSYELVQRMIEFLESREGLVTPDLRAGDLMSSALVTVDGGASLAAAAQAMERAGISQLPVLEGGRLSGSISEAGLLRALASPGRRKTRVREIQEGPYPLVDREFAAELLSGLLTRYPAVLVSVRGELRGIVTKTDLIRGLRGTPLRRAPSTAAGTGRQGS